jgi:hypothetical protein
MASSSAPKAQPKSQAPAAAAPAPSMSAFGVTIADRHKTTVESEGMSKRKKQIIMASCLLGATVLVLAWQYWPTTTEDPAVAAAPQIKPVVQAEKKKDVVALQQMVVNNDPIVASRAITALANLGDTSAADKVSRSSPTEVRMAAVSALSNGADASRIQTLSRFTTDPSPDVRMQAVAGIANIPDFQIFDPLMKMLEDPDPSVRNAALRAIEDKIGLRFRDYDPRLPSPASIAKIRSLVPKFKDRFDGYQEYKRSQQGKKK